MKNVFSRLVLLAVMCGVAVLGQVPCWQNCSNPQLYRPLQVTIGSYFVGIDSVDTTLYNARLDFYLWMRWPICAVDADGAYMRPDLTLSIEDLEDPGSLRFESLHDLPVCDAYEQNPGGPATHVYQIFRVTGVMKQDFSFSYYPLDRHLIRLSIEDSTFPISNLSYVVDKTAGGGRPASSTHQSLEIPGWNIGEMEEHVTISSYNTNWGATNPFYSYDQYAAYNVTIEISRGSTIFLLKSLPPIVFATVAAGMIFLLDPESLEARLGASISCLLTEIFLQLLFIQAIPAADYLTLIDVVFLIAYSLIFLVIVEVIVMDRLYTRWKWSAKVEEEGERLKKLKEFGQQLDEEEMKDLEDWEKRKKEKEESNARAPKRIRWNFKSARAEQQTKEYINRIEDIFFVIYMVLFIVSFGVVIVVGFVA